MKSDLLSDVQKLLGKNFNIPFYQRGYRWKKEQVRQLLDDVNEFRPTAAVPFYFLQALAITEENKDERCNVVDGQQRLTTIQLILEKWEEQGLQKADARVPENWLEYERKSDGSSSLGALDEHYRNCAKKEIASWLGKHPAELESMLQKVLAAKFLIYKIKPENERETFNRLNSGKIRAKDSELIKSIMLTPQLDEPASVTQARAQEWDSIERALNDEMFFSFFTAKNTWKEDDRMAVLLKWSGLEPGEEMKKNSVFPYLDHVQEELKKGKSRAEVWRQIYSTYYRLAAWYDDPLMYHAVGWWVHKRDQTASRFNNFEINRLLKKLHNEIKEIAELSPAKIKEIDFDNKDNATHNYLLLFNMAYCWRRWPMRYDFCKHREVSRWSLEHIFARNQGDFSDKKSLARHLNVPISDNEFITYYEECQSGKGYEWMNKKLQETCHEDYPPNEDDKLGNLALLGGAENSSLSDGFFEDKRSKIVGWASSETNNWAPPATEAVFLKALPELDMTRLFWTTNDRREYVNHMKVEIKAFWEELAKDFGSDQQSETNKSPKE